MNYWAACKAVLSGVLFFIGLAGLPDDVKTWIDWLAPYTWIPDHPLFRLMLIFIGFVLLYLATRQETKTSHVKNPIPATSFSKLDDGSLGQGGFGRFSQIRKSTELYDPGENYGGQKEYVKVFVKYTFDNDTSLRAIRATAYRFRYNGSQRYTYQGKYTWKSLENTSHLKNASIEIPLAFIALDFAHPGFYGDKKLDGYYLQKPTAHLIRVEIIYEPHARRQSKDILIIMPLDRSVQVPTLSLLTGEQYNDLDPGTRFLVFDRDAPIFPDIPKGE